MPKSDWKYFNCSEDYEINYVSGLYEKTKEVKEFIKKKCEDGTINDWTHKELYDFLDEKGFTKKQ